MRVDEDGPPSTESNAFPAERTLEMTLPMGAYEVLGSIGEGGMAEVFLARKRGAEPGFEQVVALKQVHEHLVFLDEFRRMFLDEVRVTSRIEHPFVVRVLDCGVGRSEAWYTMPYVLGLSLREVIRGALRLPEGDLKQAFPGVVIRCVIQAAEGLHAAHELRDDHGHPLGVVHRDVGPHNLMVGADGITRVLDFGIADGLQRLALTALGTLKGSKGYMAPERFQGVPVDRRADVWGLGVVLWEALTGRRLVPKSVPLHEVAATVGVPVPGLREIDPSIDYELDAIVERAVHQRPERRFATARELARELSRHLARTQQSVESGDVAEWLESVFPTELAEKRAKLAAARADEAQSAMPSSSPEGSPPGTLR